jgi:hypothetical protein
MPPLQRLPKFFHGGKGGRGVKLTTYLLLVPSFIMSGAAPLLPLYAFMSWERTALSVDLHVSVVTGPFQTEHCKTADKHLQRSSLWRINCTDLIRIPKLSVILVNSFTLELSKAYKSAVYGNIFGIHLPLLTFYSVSVMYACVSVDNQI